MGGRGEVMQRVVFSESVIELINNLRTFQRLHFHIYGGSVTFLPVLALEMPFTELNGIWFAALQELAG